MWITPLTPSNGRWTLHEDGPTTASYEEEPMDATTFLTLAVAVVIVSSGYYLFKGVPRPRARRVDRLQRPPRR
jgi:hypothetical protein